jgi:hypothetical protein
MPKAAVNEYGNPLPGEDDIRLCQNAVLGAYREVLAKPQATLVQAGTDANLGTRASLSIPTHHGRDRWGGGDRALHHVNLLLHAC